MRIASPNSGAVSIQEFGSDQTLENLLVVNRDHCRRPSLGCCLPALPEWFMLNPLFPCRLKLQPCVRLSVLIGDMVSTFLPIIIGDILLLPNQIRLLQVLAGERKHPENIVQCVQKAATKYINRFNCIPCRGRISAKTKIYNDRYWNKFR